MGKPNFQLLIESILQHIYKNFHFFYFLFIFFSPKKALENQRAYALHFEFPFSLYSMTFLQLFLDFFYMLHSSPICFSFWSARLFQNLIYICCTETLWLTSLNLYCCTWIEDTWNVTMTSDLHFWHPQSIARNLNPMSFISITHCHCNSLCGVHTFFFFFF